MKTRTHQGKRKPAVNGCVGKRRERRQNRVGADRLNYIILKLPYENLLLCKLVKIKIKIFLKEICGNCSLYLLSS